MNTLIMNRAPMNRVTMRTSSKKIVTYCSAKAPVPKSTKPMYTFSERLNGRLAMIGVLAGMASPDSYAQQIEDNWGSVLSTVAIVSYASFVTRFGDIENSEKPFTESVETLNGRVAMSGFAMKMAYDVIQACNTST